MRMSRFGILCGLLFSILLLPSPRKTVGCAGKDQINLQNFKLHDNQWSFYDYQFEYRYMYFNKSGVGSWNDLCPKLAKLDQDLGNIKGKTSLPPVTVSWYHPDHTACYRGFYATYELTEEGLYLRELTLSEKNGDYLPLEGIEPAKEDYQATYYGLSVVVPFTGKIRLAKDFIEELYIHMGYQKPTAFKTVLDLTLKDGRWLRSQIAPKRWNRNADHLRNTTSLETWRRRLKRHSASTWIWSRMAQQRRLTAEDQECIAFRTLRITRLEINSILYNIAKRTFSGKIARYSRLLIKREPLLV